ncbi:MAG: DUF2207 domain-containing protein [Parvularculaceae bacterium]
MIVRAALALLFLLWPGIAIAAERISDFDVTIDVAKSGDIAVTEKISVFAEGYQIRRGIFRDLPRSYEKGGRRYPFSYDVKRVMRDGEKEPYALEKTGNAFRIRIGDKDVFLDRGPHHYEIVYDVKNQVRYFDEYDELYWNVTGTYWAFPIDHALARIRLPDGAQATRKAGYTGGYGQTGGDYIFSQLGGEEVFETARPLRVREGLTVAVGFPKGVVDPPSASDARAEWWAANASLVILGAGASLIGLFYLWAWNRVGRDPVKGPIFPQYEAPKGLSPAAAHFVFHRGLSGHDALIATIVNLAIKKRIKIDVDSKKQTRVELLSKTAGGALPAFEENLQTDLLSGGSPLVFGKKYSSKLTSAYETFRKALSKNYGKPYFRWNRGFLILAILLSGASILLAANFALEWSAVHTMVVAALVVMALAASYFLPAPTPKGQATRTDIEGFRLYMNTAEKLQLNAVEPGSDAPPPMTVERYERFLPYAIALGVEKPWTKHFEKLMPKEAASYTPYWSSGNYTSSRSLSGINSALVSSMASGVSASMPQSSSSSGSGGGGFSGGGGGGGGGGGW